MNIKTRIRLSILLIGVLTISTHLHAQEVVPTNASTPLAEEFVSLMHIEANFDAMKSKMASLLTPQKPAGISQDAWDHVTKQSQQTMESVFSAMSWEKMKAMYVSLYAETFTPGELRGLIDFYKTPAGQKYIEKQPQFQEAVMQKSQAMMKDMMPTLMKSMPLPTAIGSSNAILPASSGTATPTP
ncbi:MAG: DUF2059 domain-containing protein [bacterium]